MDPVDLLREGQRIWVSGSSGEPTALLDHLANTSVPDNVHFVQFPLAGMNEHDYTAWNDSAQVTTFFMTPTLAKADPDRMHYVPMQMRWTFDYVREHTDVALISVAYDQNGVLRLGANVDFVEAAFQGAQTVIAQLNTDMVAAAGSPQVVPSRLDCLFEAGHAVPQLAPPKIDAAAATIGRLVAALIDDGDCIQTGIGAIPAAILNELRTKNDLGMHGGLIDDGGMALIRNGNVTGSRKAIDQHQHITGAVLGSSAVMDWLADEPSVVFRGADHTHEVSVIRQLDNFVSINSAVEIDLHGQVNAEVAGGRQISGTGGSVDFMRAAKASKNGRSIVAMTATARRGEVSRIVPRVEMATALRTDVDYVVTEYGVAHLRDLPLDARAQALIAIAAPQFRDALKDSA